MKKLFFTLGLAALIGVTVQAQQWSIGPSIGLNHAWMSDMSDDRGRIGFNAGLNLTYSNFEHLGVGLGVEYSQEGVVIERGGVDFTNRLNYVRVPLKFHIFTNGIADDFRPKLYIGPTVGFLVGGEAEMATENGLVTGDAKDVFNNTDVGIIMGVGFNYRLAEALWLNTDLNYTHGLMDVADNMDTKNRNVRVTLGVAWGF